MVNGMRADYVVIPHLLLEKYVQIKPLIDLRKLLGFGKTPMMNNVMNNSSL